jgi:hypothetical protein
VSPRLLLALVAVLPLACSLAFQISDDAASGARLRDGGADGTVALDEAAAADPDSASDAGQSAGDARVPLACKQTGRGPALVNAGDRFCIDATEVTVDQFAVFIDAGVDPATQIEHCRTNTSYVPLGATDAGDEPVNGVDWCDAFSFCAWAGKKLCGPIDDAPADAGSGVDAGFVHGLSFDDIPLREKNGWLWICQGGDRALPYPYGYDEDASAGCSEPGGGFLPPQVRRVAVGCEGPFPGLFDMTGNTQEWIDACSSGVCAAVGARKCRDVYNLPSGTLHSYDIQYTATVGFRCCGLEPPSP